MKAKSKLLAAMLPFLAMSEGNMFGKTFNEVSNGGIPDNPKKIIPKGLKEFNIRGQIVYATNKKNAIKKANKYNY